MPGGVGPIERHAEKEAQRRDGGVDNGRARAVLGQVQLETAKILIGRRIRRTTKKSCQFHNRADVVMLGLRRKMPDGHVLDHAAAKRGDAFLGHAMLLSEAGLLTPRSSDSSPPARYPRILLKLGRQPAVPHLAALFVLRPSSRTSSRFGCFDRGACQGCSVLNTAPLFRETG